VTNECFGSLVPIELAPINVSKFSGEYNELLVFQDIYIALIHNNPKIDNIQRFFHLLTSLSGEASQVNKYFETTAENYRIAWVSILARYNNQKSVDTILYIKFDLPRINEDAIQLRRLID